MRILHIDTGRQMRGGQWQVLFLLRGLARRGYESRLLSPEGSPLFQAARSEGLDARPLGWLELWRQARRADITHAHDARAHTLAALVRAPRLVVSRRVAFPVRRSVASLWKYRQAALYLPVSGYVRGKLLEAGVPAEKTIVVYDGAPPLEMSGPGAEVIAPASDDPMKGSALVREAAALAGVEVRFSSGLARDLMNAKLFIYLTKEEGLGSGILMAMSAGVPVVASRVGGIPELIEDGVTGLLTENSPHLVAACMRRLLDNPELSAALARNARLRVNERFLVDHMVEATLAAYGKVF